jgi:hypothetical protein
MLLQSGITDLSSEFWRSRLLRRNQLVKALAEL